MGIYYHIPFCRARCRYCDFNTYAGLEPLVPDYVGALMKETGLWSNYARDHMVDTVYFGGGTPSLIPAGSIRRVLDTARQAYSFSRDPEITVEANPGTLDAGYLRELRQAGVNRLSLGVQSFIDEELKMLGRIHRAEDARRTIKSAFQLGFENTNIDLIYGLPGQDRDAWDFNLGQALALEPSHLSLYGLTLEEGTPLTNDVRRGLLPSPDPDAAALMYEKAETVLDKAGYRHYEISNWARPGSECRHNLRYWLCLPYLGFGAGAHSCFAGLRFENVKQPEAYTARLTGEAPPPVLPAIPEYALRQTWDNLLASGLPVDKASPVTRRDMVSDYIILGLRLMDGIQPLALFEATGYDLEKTCKSQIDELESLGLLERLDGHLRLTRRGHLLGNEVFQRFLDPPSL
jgi:oxygen-independent coproporphyrinogen-3 oxidase